jgi:transcriptional regulator with XRE-family HTH domain
MSHPVANVNLKDIVGIDVSLIDFMKLVVTKKMSAELTSTSKDVTLGGVADDFLQAFGRVVRRLRQERGMTQAELAARLSLGRTSVTNLEKGQQSPPLAMLPDIAGALGVDPLSLVAEAVRGDIGAKTGALAAVVHDEELRRWAGQVIHGTPASQTSDEVTPQMRERRPA